MVVMGAIELAVTLFVAVVYDLVNALTQSATTISILVLTTVVYASSTVYNEQLK